MKILILALMLAAGSVAMADNYDQEAPTTENQATDAGTLDSSSVAPPTTDGAEATPNANGDQQGLTNQFDYQGGD